MKVTPLTLTQAEEFLSSHQRHYKTGATPLCALGVADDEGLHGAAVLGMNTPLEAELAHIYVDGVSSGYTTLYGACWRALKALGFKTVVL